MSPSASDPQLSTSDKAVATPKANGSQNSPAKVESWSPSSWTTKPIKQNAIYEDHNKVAKSLAKLERLPPIVTPTEIINLKASLRDVALGKAFLLQGGDCAELFDYCEENVIESKIKLLLQMSLVLIWGASKPIVRIARMAGQYAKPRSSPTEMVNGKEISSFRGDILNGNALDERLLDPSRLVDAYFHSATTLNYIRASISSGLADLHRPLDWGLGHVQDPELQMKYSKTVESITDSLKFMRTVGADTASKALETVELYTSHEGLLLPYEQSLTRLLRDPALPGATAPTEHKSWYDTSAHFVWVGDRTRQIDGAHIEFFRGIENPLGVKIGPTTASSDLLALLRALNPSREVGKITLITRYGASKVRRLLPEHIRTVEQSEYARTVVWQCDPMHGNTRSTSTGIKTRQFSDIFSELQEVMAIHKEEGSYLGGVHLELTGDAVTECTGGSEGLGEDDLSLNYTTFCDPRLNEKQALELAFLIAASITLASWDFRIEAKGAEWGQDLRDAYGSLETESITAFEDRRPPVPKAQQAGLAIMMLEQASTATRKKGKSKSPPRQPGHARNRPSSQSGSRTAGLTIDSISLSEDYSKQVHRCTLHPTSIAALLLPPAREKFARMSDSMGEEVDGRDRVDDAFPKQWVLQEAMSKRIRRDELRLTKLTVKTWTFTLNPTPV
ncbi:hypothetical protein G7Y89_g15036 [Cudoniella acicularis]|uniref:Phospho-2-dehydro-3-deoxyheptonate aldolase n=1 Tax=Cudoniella acicularis TaxID=354080 RepID=A0A8H4QX61_9HELO|nr:hypothetical protein G7Y89_g15036 [Cudoniella acicularis]